jgi:hypothetical protein
MDRPSLLRQFCLADRITSSASPRPLSGDTPDVRSDFSQRRGSANRAKESRATHAIFITMSRVNKIRHISQKKCAHRITMRAV